MKQTDAATQRDADYQTIFECSQDAILVVDPDGEIVLDANPAAARLYGRPQLIGMSMLELAAFPLRPRKVAEILRSGYLRFETTHLRSDGTPLLLDIHATVFEYRGRKAILSTNRDLTVLQESERRFRSLLANVPAILWTMDAEWNCHFVSSTVEELSGYTQREIIEAPRDWVDRVHPEDLPRVTAGYQSLFRHGTPFEVSYRFQKKDGTWVWFSDRATHRYQVGETFLADGVTQDITAQKKTEEDLRRRTDQLAVAQTIAHVGSFDLDPADGTVEWSDELYRIAGVEPESRPVAMESARDLFPSWPDFCQRLERDGTFDVEHSLTGADGQVRMVRTRAFKIIDATTDRVKVLGTVQDITEQHAAARELRERQRRLELIVGRLPVILWSTDQNFALTSLNGAGLTEPASAPNLALEDLFGPFPDEPEPCPRRALQGETVAYDLRLGQRDLRLHIEPLRDERGEITGTAGIAWDITEERRAERANRELLEQLHDAAEEWRDTFDSIHTALVIVDCDYRVQRLNRAALTLAGSSEYHEAIGSSLFHFDGTIWQDFHALARSAAAAGEPVTMQSRTGDGRHWELVASRSSHHRDRLILIASDITPIMTLQETLRRSERMSEMGALVAGVAHEVRNPLFGISATLDALEARFGSNAFGDFTAALREQVDRMSQLMYDLLEYGRPVRNALEPVEVEPVLQSAISSLAYYARQYGVQVRAICDGGLAPVNADSQRLLQVFENILKNAIEHSPSGSVIEARVSARDRQTDISFHDRGPGFNAGDLPKIYDPFFTRRRGGTGLGLSLVRRIVEEHNGRIRAENRVDGGASVTVSLPVARPQKE